MGRILEIDDDVNVAVEQAVLKELIGAMRQTGILEIPRPDRTCFVKSESQKLPMLPHRNSGHDRGLALAFSLRFVLRKPFSLPTALSEKQAIGDNIVCELRAPNFARGKEPPEARSSRESCRAALDAARLRCRL